MDQYTLPLERIGSEALREKIVSAEEASLLIKDGMSVGLSGFAGAGDAKAVPLALAERINQSGEAMKISVFTGASLGLAVETAISDADIIAFRAPYQTNPSMRKRINKAETKFTDINLGGFSRMVKNDSFGRPLDIAVIEATALTPEGHIYPTTSVGVAPAMIEKADKVIVEINTTMPMQLCGMADVYDYGEPPFRAPLPLTRADQRIGVPYVKCGMHKIAAIVISEHPDTVRKLAEPDETSQKISEHLLAFFRKEVERGALPKNLLPLQSGVGSVANAVLLGLQDSDLEGLCFYAEVLQDGMLDLILSGKAVSASTTGIPLTPAGMKKFCDNADMLKDKIILRPQELSNGSEPIHRLGVISMNTALEADIYGNINSTHVMGTNMMNGIGGSGDFTQNAYISIFTTASTAKNGAISSIVPMVSHIDHTEHNVMVLVTEQGYADLRGLCPRDRALAIINNCVHPDYRDALLSYFNRACEEVGGHTPHILSEALSWHIRFKETGSMK